MNSITYKDALKAIKPKLCLGHSVDISESYRLKWGEGLLHRELKDGFAQMYWFFLYHPLFYPEGFINFDIRDI